MIKSFYYLAIVLTSMLLFTACGGWPVSNPDPDPILRTVLTSVSVEPDTVKLGDIVTLSVSHYEENNSNFTVEWYPPTIISAEPLDATYLIPINGVIDSTVVQFDTALFADSTLAGIINRFLTVRVVDTTFTNPLYLASSRSLDIFINYNK